MSERWNAGLFDCFSHGPSCLSVFFCQPCAIGQTTSIASGGSAFAFWSVTAVLLTLWVLSMFFGAFPLILAIASFVAILYARCRIRERRNLIGGPTGDVLSSLFCGACSVCQMLNEYGPYRGFWSSYETVHTVVPEPVRPVPDTTKLPLDV